MYLYIYIYINTYIYIHIHIYIYSYLGGSLNFPGFARSPGPLGPRKPGTATASPPVCGAPTPATLWAPWCWASGWGSCRHRWSGWFCIRMMCPATTWRLTDGDDGDDGMDGLPNRLTPGWHARYLYGDWYWYRWLILITIHRWMFDGWSSLWWFKLHKENHLFFIGFHHCFMVIWWDFPGFTTWRWIVDVKRIAWGWYTYPLVMTNIAIDNYEF